MLHYKKHMKKKEKGKEKGKEGKEGKKNKMTSQSEAVLLAFHVLYYMWKAGDH